MLPCAAQGALGIETRAGDTRVVAALATLSHGPTHLAALAERAVSRTLGGSCSMPLAAYAMWRGEALFLRALLGHSTEPASPLLRAEAMRAVTSAAEAEALGIDVAGALAARGAAAYLAAADAARPAAPVPSGEARADAPAAERGA